MDAILNSAEPCDILDKIWQTEKYTFPMMMLADQVFKYDLQGKNNLKSLDYIISPEFLSELKKREKNKLITILTMGQNNLGKSTFLNLLISILSYKTQHPLEKISAVDALPLIELFKFGDGLKSCTNGADFMIIDNNKSNTSYLIIDFQGNNANDNKSELWKYFLGFDSLFNFSSIVFMFKRDKGGLEAHSIKDVEQSLRHMHEYLKTKETIRKEIKANNTQKVMVCIGQCDVMEQCYKEKLEQEIGQQWEKSFEKFKKQCVLEKKSFFKNMLMKQRVIYFNKSRHLSSANSSSCLNKHALCRNCFKHNLLNQFGRVIATIEEKEKSPHLFTCKRFIIELRKYYVHIRETSYKLAPEIRGELYSDLILRRMIKWIKEEEEMNKLDLYALTEPLFDIFFEKTAFEDKFRGEVEGKVIPVLKNEANQYVKNVSKFQMLLLCCQDLLTLFEDEDSLELFHKFFDTNAPETRMVVHIFEKTVKLWQSLQMSAKNLQLQLNSINEEFVTKLKAFFKEESELNKEFTTKTLIYAGSGIFSGGLLGASVTSTALKGAALPLAKVAAGVAIGATTFVSIIGGFLAISYYTTKWWLSHGDEERLIRKKQTYLTSRVGMTSKYLQVIAKIHSPTKAISIIQKKVESTAPALKVIADVFKGKEKGITNKQFADNCRKVRRDIIKIEEEIIDYHLKN